MILKHSVVQAVPSLCVMGYRHCAMCTVWVVDYTMMLSLDLSFKCNRMSTYKVGTKNKTKRTIFREYPCRQVTQGYVQLFFNFIYIYILYLSQPEIKAVVRSHNEEHISLILSYEPHLSAFGGAFFYCVVLVLFHRLTVVCVVL